MQARNIALAVAAAAVMSSSAYASTVSGSVWENSTSYPNTLSTTPPSGSPTATFTLGGTGDIFNFVSGGSNDLTADPTYTLGGFLTSGGDSLTFQTGSTASGDSINNDTFQFTGTTYLTAGTTYTINHDDGMYLFLTGNGLTNYEEIDSGAPTSNDPSSFTVAVTGFYSFDLLYAEVNGAPADLYGTLGTISSTPEPSSIMMLGSGLLAGAGIIRRRIKA